MKSKILFFIAMVACIACSAQSDYRADTLHENEMSNNRKIFDYVQDLTDFGPRRSGSEAAVKTADYIAGKFSDFGLQNVSIETGNTVQWNATKWGLEVNGEHIPAFYMRHSFYSGKMGGFSTGPEGLEAEFVYVGNRKDLQGIDVKGKIVVADVELSKVDMGRIKGGADFIYDPGQTLHSDGRLDPFTPNNYPFNIISAVQHGAAGFIGVLSNYIDSNRFYNEDVAYLIGDDLYFSVPALWVSHEDGKALKNMIKEASSLKGKLTLEGTVETVKYRTVVGHLPGKSDEILMVQSHHDSGFMGAVEDASGTAEVLALAEYYSQQPINSRQRGMMFVTMDTHFTDYQAHVDLAENYILKGGLDIVANVTVEHIAREMLVKDGLAVMSGEVDPRIFITSPSLLELTRQKIEKHDYRRSMVISTDFFSDYNSGIPTDVGVIQDIVGMPVISLISAPVYLYDIADTLDKIAVEELQPTALLVAEMLDSLDTMPREQIGRTE
jgi:hypothetical protein